MTAPIGAGWKVGDKVFCIKNTSGIDGHPDYREDGYIVTITAATPARVKVGERTWTRHGRAYGGDSWAQGYLRPLMDGDDARDAAWREKVRAANAEKRRIERADRLGHLDWREWRKLPPEQVETIHGWLVDAGVKS